jgi:hypothetical protein
MWLAALSTGKWPKAAGPELASGCLTSFLPGCFTLRVNGLLAAIDDINRSILRARDGKRKYQPGVFVRCSRKLKKAFCLPSRPVSSYLRFTNDGFSAATCLRGSEVSVRNTKCGIAVINALFHHLSAPNQLLAQEHSTSLLPENSGCEQQKSPVAKPLNVVA